nr:HipA domain-containing protein [Rhizobium sp. CF122]
MSPFVPNHRTFWGNACAYLMHASHREASLNYEQLHKLTLMMTRDSSEVLQIFQRMVFNVYARNQDDHAKNHPFWTLSPTYDLTFSSGPGGEHSADVAGEGRSPGMQHLLTVSREASLAYVFGTGGASY